MTIDYCDTCGMETKAPIMLNRSPATAHGTLEKKRPTLMLCAGCEQKLEGFITELKTETQKAKAKAEAEKAAGK